MNKSLNMKFHLPIWFLMVIAHAADGLGWILNKKFKLNPFNVKMLTIHRYFNIDNSIKDLKYEPVIKFEDGWQSNIEWHKKNWLPGYLKSRAAGKGSGIANIGKKHD